MSDVIDLGSEKQKRSKKKEGDEDGPSKAELCYRAAWAMVKKALDWPPFPEDFQMIKPARSDPHYIQVFKNEDGDWDYCQPAKQLDIERSILKYFSTNSKTSNLSMTPKDCAMVFEYWQRLANPFEEKIAPVLFKSDKGITWKRLDFDPTPMETPLFDELMSRTEESLVVMAYIGSIFVSSADRQQWLCLHGDGKNGKSRLGTFLSKCLGDACQSAKPPRGEAKFWNAQLLGRRLITFADCDDLKFLNTANFKSLTGADRIPIEYKGENVFDAEIDTKFLIISNEKPKLDNTVSDVRRALYSEIAPFNGKEIQTEVYNQKLWEEAPGVIFKCLEAYRQLCPDHGPIAFQSETFSDLVAEAEEELEHRARRWFQLWPIGHHDEVPFCSRPYVKADYMILIKCYERLSDAEYERFKNFLQRTYGIHHRRVKVDGVKTYRYLNCAENPDRPRTRDEIMNS